MTSQNKEYYSIEVVCGNCNFAGKVLTLKGKTISTRSCDICGCKTLTAKPVVTNSAGQFTYKCEKNFDNAGDIFAEIGKSVSELFVKKEPK